jgi:hypothetical protein
LEKGRLWTAGNWGIPVCMAIMRNIRSEKKPGIREQQGKPVQKEERRQRFTERNKNKLNTIYHVCSFTIL